MSDDLIGLDRWIQGSPRVDSGNGKREAIRVTCAVCKDSRDWRVALEHWKVTGHPQSYHGTIQDVTKWE